MNIKEFYQSIFVADILTFCFDASCSMQDINTARTRAEQIIAFFSNLQKKQCNQPHYWTDWSWDSKLGALRCSIGVNVNFADIPNEDHLSGSIATFGQNIFLFTYPQYEGFDVYKAMPSLKNQFEYLPAVGLPLLEIDGIGMESPQDRCWFNEENPLDLEINFPRYRIRPFRLSNGMDFFKVMFTVENAVRADEFSISETDLRRQLDTLPTLAGESIAEPDSPRNLSVRVPPTPIASDNPT